MALEKQNNDNNEEIEFQIRIKTIKIPMRIVQGPLRCVAIEHEIKLIDRHDIIHRAGRDHLRSFTE